MDTSMNKPTEILHKRFMVESDDGICHSGYLIKPDHLTALQALHAATIAALPKERDYRGNGSEFNECLEQVRAAIDELYGVTNE